MKKVCKHTLSKLGFCFSENMYGRYAYKDGNSGPYNFTVRCKAEDLCSFLGGKRKKLMDLEGMINIGSSGIICSTEIAGSLVLFEERKLKYRFSYTDPFTNWAMVYNGSKNLSLLHPVKSMTTLYGKIYRIPGMVEVADVLSSFRLSELLTFLGSWRLYLA